MATTLAPNYTKREYRWTDWKTIAISRGFLYQYEEENGLYTIWGYDGPEVHTCQIWTGTVPDSITPVYSQAQNDADKSDFETNYKPAGNKSIASIDTDGAQIVRTKAAKRGWTYTAIPVEVTTSKCGGDAYSKKADGTDRTYFTVKAYNASSVEVTSPGLANINLATITSLVVDFEPPFDYEIIGGYLRVLTDVTSDIRVWIIAVPDVSEAYGGSKEMAGGINLRYLSPGNVFQVDGRVTKILPYNATYHTNKLRFIFKHDAGITENFSIVLELYKQ